MAPESRHEDTTIIHDEAVTRVQDLGEVTELVVRDRSRDPVDDHQSGIGAMRGGGSRDKIGGKFVIVSGNIVGVVRHAGWPCHKMVTDSSVNR